MPFPNVTNSPDGVDGLTLVLSNRSIHAQEYGVVADGVTDDTSALQIAIDAVVSAGGRRLMLPAGTIVLSAKLSVSHCNNFELIGEGKLNTILLWADNATKGIEINTTSPSPVSSSLTADAAIGAREIDVTNGALFAEGDYAFLDDNATRNGSFTTKVRSVAGNVVTLDGALPINLNIADSAKLFSYQTFPLVKGIVIRGITFMTNATTPTAKLTLLQMNRCDGALVEDCEFIGSTGPLITLVTCLDSIFRDNYFAKAYTVAGTGIEVQTSTGITVTNNTFTICQFGIVFSASPYCKSIGNTIGGRATVVPLGRGTRLDNQSNFGVVANNKISDTNLYGIYLQDTAHCSLVGNTLNSCGNAAGEHGIQVGGFEDDFCHHNTIAGNTIRDSFGYGIIINPTSAAPVDLFNVITGNNIYKCYLGAVACTTGASKNTIVGNFCHGADTTVGGVVRVAALCGYNVIVGNNITIDNPVAPGILTLGSAGFNFIDGNIYDGTTGVSLHANDQIGATIADLVDYSPRQPIVNTTQVATGANTNEDTVWTIPIPAGALSLTTHGMRFTGLFTAADNANAKNMNFKIGGSTFSGLVAYAPGSAFKVGFEAELIYLTNTTCFVWVKWEANILPVSRANPGWTNANVSGVDFAAGFNITITMQNGTASANDITWHGGKAVFEGVATA